MKRMIMTALVALTGSLAMAQDHNNHSDKKTITGSGKMITKEFPVQAFDQLAASGVFNLKLAQGSKEGVKIEADDNLMELFEVTNEGSKLKVAMKKDQNLNTKHGLTVYVTFRNLKAMDLKMVGGASNEGELNFDALTLDNKSVGRVDLNLSANKLSIDNKSVGDLELSGKASDVVINNKSVGSIQASNFVVQKMNIDNNGIGNAEVNAEKECIVKDNFLGKVKNKGAATVKKGGKTS